MFGFGPVELEALSTDAGTASAVDSVSSAAAGWTVDEVFAWARDVVKIDLEQAERIREVRALRACIFVSCRLYAR